MTSSTSSNDSSSSSEDESPHDPTSIAKSEIQNEEEEEEDHDDDASDGQQEEDDESQDEIGDDEEEEDDDDNNNNNNKEYNEEDEEEDKKMKKKSKKIKKKKKVHRLSLTETENFNEKLKKRGVIYIARIPPKLTPTKIKSLLTEFCEVTRIYLVEEDASKRKRRKKEYGRSGGKRYVEGWVEMSSKKKAKMLALQLNNTPISNHKRNPHYGDLWNLKYLPKFQWSHLTEKVAYERRVREQKLRIEMMHSRRENAAFVEMVETGKKLDKIESRRKKHKLDDDDDENHKSNKRQKQQKRHTHHQTKPLHEGSDKSAKKALLGGLV